MLRLGHILGILYFHLIAKERNRAVDRMMKSFKIDEEKAKKLSEDLDLLDGLRLSVQHCEEVMEQNKDRFPILEKTNQILVEQNQQIKDDIAEVEAAIAKLKGENAE